MKFERTGVIINTERYDECVSFYEGILELPVMFRKDEEVFKLTCLEFGSSYLMIEMGGICNSSGKSMKESATKLRFNVIDLEDVLSQLSSKGVNTKIENYSWGSTINIFDPDGNRVGIRDESKFFK